MSDTDPGVRVERRRKPRGRWLAAAQFLLGLLVFVQLTLLAIALSGSSLPIPARLTERIESRVNDGLEFGRVELGQVSLLLDSGQPPQIVLEDVGIFGGDDAEIVGLETVQTRLVARQLLTGTVAPDEIRLSGAHVRIGRGQDGQFSLSFGTGTGANSSLASLLGGLNRVLDTGPLAQLSSIVADDLKVTVVDRQTERVWQAVGGILTMQRTGNGLELTAMTDFRNDAGLLTSASLTVSGQSVSSDTDISVTIENGKVEDIAVLSPTFSFLSAVDAPISGTFAARLGGDGEMTESDGTLLIGPGYLRAAPDARPIGLEGAQIEFAYDPGRRSLTFSRIEVDSDFLTTAGEGTAILEDSRDRQPDGIVAQFALSGISINPQELYDEPVEFEAGSVDLRLRLSPLRLEIGQMTLRDADWHLTGGGYAIARAAGWDIALDATLDTFPLDRLQSIWPNSIIPEFRAWFGNGVTEGRISDLHGAIRIPAKGSPDFALSGHFSDVSFSSAGPVPPVRGIGGYMSLFDGALALSIEEGAVVPPLGGDIAIAGSVFGIRDIFAPVRRAEATVHTESSITSVLSLLSLPPLELLEGTDLEADLAEGRARLSAEVTFDRLDADVPAAPSFEITGQLLDTVSDKLVKNRRIQARVLDVRADPDGIEIGGSGHLGKVPVNATWSQGFGPGDKGKSRVSGTAELSPVFLDEFGIELPPGSVTGAGVARIIVDMTGDGSPGFDLDSDLTGVGLRLRALGWSKPPDRTGTLGVTGRFGERAEVENLVIKASGLTATGSVEFAQGLQLERARFDRVTVGDWLDGQVTLTGRGAGLAPAVAMNGGTVDIRSARLNPGSGGQSGPLTLALDQLLVSENIALTDVVGQFATDRGLEGNFTASVNDGPPVRGVLAPGRSGTTIRIASSQAGAVLSELGLFRNARGGTMDVSLTPTGEPGVYDGRMKAVNVGIIDAPVMAELLSSISIVGLLDQLASGAITMSRIDADFQLSPGYLTLHPSRAVGPSLGISLEGVHDFRSRSVNMQGVISPVYFLNAIGQLFTRGGEGLFGFTFQLTGNSRNPRVSVNPISILAPGMFREIFRAPPPTPP